MVHGEVPQRPVGLCPAAGFACGICQNSAQQSTKPLILASVPGTPQAEAALLAITAPTTATVSRRETKTQVDYDGEPQFKSITGTDMSYAVNAKLPVILADENYYAVDNGVWFTAKAATGPWEVATGVPEKRKEFTRSRRTRRFITPRLSTFMKARTTWWKWVYTPGYEGAYEDDGTVVYGTGCNYDPWCGDSYYPDGAGRGAMVMSVCRGTVGGSGATGGIAPAHRPTVVIDNVSTDRWREGDHVIPMIVL